MRRFTGEVIGEFDFSPRADLFRADLSRANLSRADLSGANLSEANLSRANLSRADLSRSNLFWANLSMADLSRADLSRADLSGTILPCGVSFDVFVKDPLAGLCQEPEARDRALAAWGHHKWTNCPMHAGLGISSLDDVKGKNRRLNVAAFVALFDANLLPRPEK